MISWYRAIKDKPKYLATMLSVCYIVCRASTRHIRTIHLTGLLHSYWQDLLLFVVRTRWIHLTVCSPNSLDSDSRRLMACNSLDSQLIFIPCKSSHSPYDLNCKCKQTNELTNSWALNRVWKRVPITPIDRPTDRPTDQPTDRMTDRPSTHLHRHLRTGLNSLHDLEPIVE